MPVKRIIERSEYPLIKLLYEVKTLKEIGTCYGVSGERIRQILQKIDPNYKRQPHKQLYVCHLCEKEFLKVNRKGVAKNLCKRCFSWIKRRGNNPFLKRIRRFNNELPTPCKQCQIKPARSLGLCMNCYLKLRYHTIPLVREKSLLQTRIYRQSNPTPIEQLRKNCRIYYAKHREEILQKGKEQRKFLKEHQADIIQ